MALLLAGWFSFGPFPENEREAVGANPGTLPRGDHDVRVDPGVADIEEGDVGFQRTGWVRRPGPSGPLSVDVAPDDDVVVLVQCAARGDTAGVWINDFAERVTGFGPVRVTGGHVEHVAADARGGDLVVVVGPDVPVQVEAPGLVKVVGDCGDITVTGAGRVEVSGRVRSLHVDTPGPLTTAVRVIVADDAQPERIVVRTFGPVLVDLPAELPVTGEVDGDAWWVDPVGYLHRAPHAAWAEGGTRLELDAPTTLRRWPRGALPGLGAAPPKGP